MGFDETGAVVELLKHGFLFEIIEIVHREDPSKEPETVIGQFPEPGEAVTIESYLRIEINDYVPEEPEDETPSDNSDNSSSSNDTSSDYSEDEFRHE